MYTDTNMTDSLFWRQIPYYLQKWHDDHNYSKLQNENFTLATEVRDVERSVVWWL